MAVDFSRALKVKSPSKGVVTFYGLTESYPLMHYVCFRSQSATRYIPMTANGGSVLFARIGGAQYGAYGTMTYTINFSNTISNSVRFISKLTTISLNQDGVSLASTVKIQYFVDNTSKGITTITFNANTRIQTYNTELYNGLFYPPTKIAITVTVNGVSKTTNITSYTREGTQRASVIFQFAPWIN